MFYDKTMPGADYSASCTPVNGLQAVADFDALAPARTAISGPSAAPKAERGTWFDEGYDLLEPEGTVFTAAILDAIAAVDTGKNTRKGEKYSRNG